MLTQAQKQQVIDAMVAMVLTAPRLGEPDYRIDAFKALYRAGLI